MVHAAVVEDRSAASSQNRDRIGSPALVELMRTLLGTDAGFTIDVRTGCPVRTGLAVCADPALTVRVPLDDCDDDVFGSWLARIAPALSPRGVRDRYVGGWHARSTGVVHLDVVRVVPVERRHLAEMIGRRHRQHAIFDLAAMTLVPLAT